jgi:hypothetical protein
MLLAGLRCDTCSVKLEGPFQAHEFMFLSEEDLQFLRIFIQFEGRVRDMEAPLGLSYPTIRNRITEFKERLFNASTVFFDEAQKKKTIDEKNPLEVLSDLDDGEISFEDALKAIRKNKKGKKS